MEVLPSREALQYRFEEVRKDLQLWMDTHVLPSSYIVTEAQRREKQEHDRLIKKFYEAEQSLLEYDSVNLTAKDINKLNEIELIKEL